MFERLRSIRGPINLKDNDKVEEYFKGSAKLNLIFLTRIVIISRRIMLLQKLDLQVVISMRSHVIHFLLVTTSKPL